MEVAMAQKKFEAPIIVKAVEAGKKLSVRGKGKGEEVTATGPIIVTPLPGGKVLTLNENEC